MQWTTERPSNRGFYWFKPADIIDSIYVHLIYICRNTDLPDGDKRSDG
jgi:hypothetical protein